MAAQPEISVIVPTHNSAGTIQACLEAVFSSDFKGYEVIVTDDGSTDDTLKISAGFPCRVVRSGTSRGASATRNAGAGSAAGRILMFVDSDILIAPDALGKVAGTLANGACAAVVGLLDKEAVYKNLSSFYKNAYMHYTYSILPPAMDVFYTSAAAIRKEAFFDAGCFDERYLSASIEDTEVGGRIRAKGYRIVLDKTLTVRHMRHYSLGELLGTGFRRTSGITKIVLRRAFGGSGETTFLTSPRRFTAGIALSLAACALLLLSPLAGWPFLLTALCMILVSLIANRGFLIFIFRHGGAAKAVLSIPLLVLDQIAHGLGALHGAATYLAGKRY